MNLLKKNRGAIIGFILGVILASSLTVYAYSYFATDVKYKDNKSVAQALDELYANKKNTTDDRIKITSKGEQTLDKYYKNIDVEVGLEATLLWENPDPTVAFKEQTIPLDLSKYKYIVIDSRFDWANEGIYYKTVVEVGKNGNTSSNLLNGFVTTRRDVETTKEGVKFSLGKWSDYNGTHTGDMQCIPHHIWGIR